MRRREFITLVSVTAAWPVAAHARQRRVTVLTNVTANDLEGQRNFKAIADGLDALGWKSGQNLTIDFRGIGGNVRLVEPVVTESIRASPDVIVSSSGPILTALEKHTDSIPIVFLEVMDPVAAGFVRSLRKPGQNITGFTNFEPQFGGKWLEILKAVAPDTARVVVILNPDISPQIHMLDAIRHFAVGLRIDVVASGVRNESDVEPVFDQNAKVLGTGVIVLPNPITIANRDMLVRAANDRRVPTIYPNKYFVEIGGLVSYGIDLVVQYRQAAGYVDRILRGEKSGDLPIQAPTKFELAINTKTAKALGLTIPQTLLATADEVIE